MRGTRLALTCLHQHRLTSVEGEVRGQYSAAAANAVDDTVERRVLLVDWIVRVRQVLLGRHLIGARLAVADRCGKRQSLVARVRRWRCSSIPRIIRMDNRHRSVDQDQQHYRRDQLSHDGSPKLGPPLTIMVTGGSITRAANLTFCSNAQASLRADFG